MTEIRRGTTKSCGCLGKNGVIKHYKSRTPEYRVWVDMKTRCLNKKHKWFKDYGGRGIKVCLRWQESFSEFYRIVGDKPFPEAQLDRINNDKGYYPNNVRWVTPKENSNNTRKTKLITYKGETKTINEWSESTGLSRDLLRSRLKENWEIGRMLTTPKIEKIKRRTK